MFAIIGTILTSINPSKASQFPLDTSDWPWGDTKEVYWSDQTYFLKAREFAFSIAGEADGEEMSMSGATNVEVDGDPGSATYFSVEITWTDEESLERRLNMYFSADETSFEATEMRLYDQSQEWVYFEAADVAQFAGERSACLREDALVIESGDNLLRFSGLSFALVSSVDEDTLFECADAVHSSTTTTVLSFSLCTSCL